MQKKAASEIGQPVVPVHWFSKIDQQLTPWDGSLALLVYYK